MTPKAHYKVNISSEVYPGQFKNIVKTVAVTYAVEWVTMIVEGTTLIYILFYLQSTLAFT
jgi:hypothetical protein